jgi:uncharacterized cupredoxin-like copper-binding protein
MKTRILFLPVTLALLVLAVASCGGGSSSPSSSPATPASSSGAATVNVDANEFSFALDRQTVPAGKVTFVVQNAGQVVHEMVIIRTDAEAGELPFADGEASEEGAVGEIGPEELGSGVTGHITMDLKPGHYAMICNLPGHYEGGMYADFTVV